MDKTDICLIKQNLLNLLAKYNLATPPTTYEITHAQQAPKIPNFVIRRKLNITAAIADPILE